VRNFPDTIYKLLGSHAKALLISGRAGTGKTTLVKEILSDTKVKQVVLAQTGVAALQVGGQTIHSFFRIPPGLNDISGIPPIYGKRAMLIRSIDRIIFDEISMVRADLLDIVDLILRKIRRINTPFGGVQVVMVGDFYQLPPVVGNNERSAFNQYYENRYMFASNVMKEIDLKMIELTEVFRQKDNEFINILGNIREGKDIENSVDILNNRCLRDHRSGKIPLLLTSHNSTAVAYNANKLKELPDNIYEYRGRTDGDFNLANSALPAPEILQLKVGARVMMTKNDNKHFRWVNGSLGTVESLSANDVSVKIDDSSQICEVTQLRWERYSYDFNVAANRIDKKIVGRYTQFPMQLAWASTIHKAQGLTLDDVRLDMGDGSFECGQTYVALSRATSLDGLSFTHPLREEDVIVDHDLAEYMFKYCQLI
jgi:hypothetical protein